MGEFIILGATLTVCGFWWRSFAMLSLLAWAGLAGLCSIAQRLETGKWLAWLCPMVGKSDCWQADSGDCPVSASDQACTYHLPPQPHSRWLWLRHAKTLMLRVQCFDIICRFHPQICTFNVIYRNLQVIPNFLDCPLWVCVLIFLSF